jgi:Zn-dependent protease with chaperone function
VIELVAAAIVAALAAPHLLDQSRLVPAAGIALWLGVLTLRAVVALTAAAITILFLPATELFRLLTHWCLHTVIPFFATHLGFDGHRLGDAAILVPSLVLALSALWAGFGVWSGARTVRRWLRRGSLGPGPRESVVVGGPDVVVAAAGLRDPRVVVSAGALIRLDDDELAAGLEHEWGHITRHHRFAAVVGQLLYGISRLLPGSSRALELLRFQLERDADEFAVRRTGDPLALASAISKAVTDTGAAEPTPALARLGGTGVPERLRLLLGEGGVGPSSVGTTMARGLALLATVLALALTFSAPSLAPAATDQLAPPRGEGGTDCRT